MNRIQQASGADEFGPCTRILTLPVPGPNGPLRVEIESATMETLIPLLRGIRGAGSVLNAESDADGLAATEQFITEYTKEARLIVERYVRSPKFVFDGPEDGAVEWSSLHLINRVALVNGISRLSRDGVVGEAAQLASFSDVEHGGPAGGGPAATGEPGSGNGTAPVVPEASEAQAG